ncbi:MAG: signal peptidase I [Bacteroidota bacterium]
MDGAALFYYGVFFLIYGGFTVGLYKLFEKAGIEAWKALIPVYSSVLWAKLIGKPIWWVVLLFIPLAQVLVLVAMVIELAKAYGKYKLKHHAAALFIPFYFFPKIGFDADVKYLGPPDQHKNLPKKSSMREWGDAILFAGVAALIIRTVFIEAFMIPTSSMERTLMAGDFLFVSKFHYGSRMPMVPLSVPFFHNKISVRGATMKSYLDFLQLPYFRFPGVTKISRNDIVVFNYPAHDIDDLGDGVGKVKPISMKENYIKRCVAMPGDKLEIKNQQIYINDQLGWNPAEMQYKYQVETDGTGFSPRKLNQLGFRNKGNANLNWVQVKSKIFYFFMPDSIAQIIKSFDNVVKVDTMTRLADTFQPEIYPSYNNPKGELFFHNIHNYGPITLPKAGMTVDLTPKNISLYFRPISAYEGHEVEMKGDKITIDGQEASSYTFKYDYYFMMGDNRDNSEDSRFWGFVPETHIVGKPLFVFFSYESDFGIRWNRIGTKYVH